MKVRFEVESAQIAMAGPDALLVQLAEGGFIEVEKIGGGSRRLTLADWAKVWKKYQESKKLVQVTAAK